MRPNTTMFDEQMALCDDMLRARSVDGIRSIVARSSHVLGFEHFLFSNSGSAIGTPSSTGKHHYFHNLTGAWQAWVDTRIFPWGEQLSNETTQFLYRMPPLLWNSLSRTNLENVPTDMRTTARRRHRLSGEHGMHSGISIPVQIAGANWSVVSFMSGARADKPDLTPRMLLGQYLAHCMQAALADLVGTTRKQSTQLSTRESEILRWSAVGKTSWEIAGILNISERTVNFHLTRTAGKLGVNGRRAAVAQAIALRLIVL